MRISAGAFHTVVLKSDGNALVWGFNHNGQWVMGPGQKKSPVQVGTDSNWTGVAAGYAHTVASKSDGTLWAWGHNKSAQLGDDTGVQRNSPVQVGKDKDWASITAGHSHTVALKSDGTLWAWGDNRFAQLGTAALLANIGQIKSAETPTGLQWQQATPYRCPQYQMERSGHGETIDMDNWETERKRKEPLRRIGKEASWIKIVAGYFSTRTPLNRREPCGPGDTISRGNWAMAVHPIVNSPVSGGQGERLDSGDCRSLAYHCPQYGREHCGRGI